MNFEKIIKAFVILALFYLVASNPDLIVNFLQMFVDAAYKVATALSNFNFHNSPPTTTTG